MKLKCSGHGPPLPVFAIYDLPLHLATMQDNEHTHGSYAMFRLPACGEESHTLECEPEELDDVSLAAGRTGFIFAPFDLSGPQPILFFPGESRLISQPSRRCGPTATAEPRHDGGQGDYAESFSTLHSLLRDKKLRKVVLSRRAAVACPQAEGKARELYSAACEAYPQAFVALISAPRCGTWLMATPELLLESRGGTLRTMALAGTMRTRPEGLVAWCPKNKDEQAVVAQYVAETLAPFAQDLETRGPETTYAANLAHLRTLFTFTLRPGARVTDLIAALHPTPAVCGLPKAAALEALRAHEGAEREYYSGFAGALQANGDANVFVTLRCMKLSGDACTLFAGGGLMPESQMEDEWTETEAKMSAMANLLRT